MKALTISQPFASMIASGEKFVENRTWATNYRGPIAIHAGKGTQYMTRRDLEKKGLPLGAIVAYAKLQACVRLDDFVGSQLPSWLSAERFLFNEHTEGPWCWILGNVRRLEYPIAATGAQGLWEWNEPLNMNS